MTYPSNGINSQHLKSHIARFHSFMLWQHKKIPLLILTHLVAKTKILDVVILQLEFNWHIINLKYKMHIGYMQIRCTAMTIGSRILISRKKPRRLNRLVTVTIYISRLVFPTPIAVNFISRVLMCKTW